MPMPNYFEDFEVGATRRFGEYNVTREEILEFAEKHDPQPFHLSDEAAARTLFGSLCASGWHTSAMAMRMIVENMRGGGEGEFGSPGINELRRQGNQRHYQANPDCPLFKELRSITRKTFGLTDVLKKALEPLTDRIEWAFVFGSIASGKDSATSDIDLMLIGEISFAESVAALHPAQASLQREINPKVYHPDEWQHLVDQNDAFVSEVLAKPRLEIMEQRNELAESGRDQP